MEQTEETVKQEQHLIRTNHVVINGITLTDKQATILFEAINGNREFGSQYDYYIEQARHIPVEEQDEVILSIYNLFRQ